MRNNDLIDTPDLTWSSSGTTSIAYSKGNWVGSTAPTWAIFNSATAQLHLFPPDVSVDTDFWFIIQSTISGVTSSIQKTIKVTVKNWIALNWDKCLNTSNSVWSQWATGYSSISGIWTIASSSTTSNSSSNSSSSSNSGSNGNNSNQSKTQETAETSQALTTTTQSIAGATVVVVIFASIMNTSSIASLWSMINQSQMFFLLILTRAFIPDEILTEITGSSFALNPTMYIPFKRIGIYRTFIENFNFGLSNSLLDPLGFKSDSIVYSNASSFILILIVSMTHLAIFLLNKLLLNWRADGTWSWLIKIIVRIVKKIYEVLTFGYYIRFALELNQITLISSNSEIYLFSTSSGFKIVSLIVSFIVLFLWLVFIAIPIYLTFASYKLDESQHNKLGDFFIGLKPQKRFRSYLP